MKITRFDEHGQELKPGLRSIHPHNHTTPKFTIVTMLETMDPDEWRAEVMLFDETIISVPGTCASHAAGNATEAALRRRLVALFRGTE